MLSLTCITNTLFTSQTQPNPISPTPLNHFPTNPIKITKTPLKPISLSSKRPLLLAKSSDSETYPDGETVSDTVQDEWLTNLPDKNKPLYAHSLPCIEAWLTSLGFYQSHDDLAVWFIHKSDWHAQLSLDLTDLYVRYLKSGPGNLEKDVERRFSYALSREDIENAVLGGP